MQKSGNSLSGLVQTVRTDERFRQLQKLEVVGRLAGGVAHDFNNLLTVIIGYTDILQNKHVADSGTSSLLNEIRQAGERASLLTRQLLLFSRKEKMQPVVLNLNDRVSGLVKMLHRLIGDDIELTTDLDPQLGHVRADPGQIEQVIMNLAINARDAMPKGGKLQIETRNLILGPHTSGENSRIPAGSWTTLVVRDTGCGMNEDVLAHLFEPFFTTKEVGKGTGLGLATVHSVVTESGGHVRVASKPGLGTRFRIFLPQVLETARPQETSSARTEHQVGVETILLVDDDTALRKLAALSLRTKGYTVLEAADGGQAMSLAVNNRVPINLMVTDVIMPIMSGPQLAAKLTARYPELKVLYISGYTDSLLAPHDERDIRGAFLQKPFTPDGLVSAVQRMLTPSLC